MATIVLSAAGAALGASIGGGVLGLSSVVIGRAIGATLGRAIDQSLLGAGSDPIETGKVDRFRLMGASEGMPVPQIYGRTRVAGQVIWATRFQEHKTRSGGKGMSPTPKTVDYSYTVSLAVALCEGEITRIGRIWADGAEVPASDLNLRVYTGGEDQMPDPKIEAVQGAGQAPAYRGIAYVVFEDLDVTRFGNRIPQLNFEVIRPETRTQDKEIARGTRAVAIMPGSGEYALATTRVTRKSAPGVSLAVNSNTPSGKTDFETSLDVLTDELPNCGAASLVVSWFGDDLRADSCTLRPKVEGTGADGAEIPWSVSGLSRATAEVVPSDVAGKPIYGGTPTDQSVKEAITALADSGKSVTFYPFLLMDQTEGNALPDPWTGGAGQPHLPWRGRITLSTAPGRDNTPDQTTAAEAEVAAFFGMAQPDDFTVTETGVTYTGAAEWSYRRMILHYAHLCAGTGGVDAFLIGSEMRSLTQIRGANNSFPAVAQLVQLAADVRGILGPEVRIGYAADWSEYFGYHPQDGSGDLFYHLDPLWADDNIDFIGIDNYMPLSDWRDEDGEADAEYGSIYNLDYLKSNIQGGEGYDWYYHTDAAETAQLRTPITDGTHNEPWVWRVKDITNWWTRTHHERVGGLRNETPTLWLPGSKPIWFTELGCAALDKGTNQPNKFLDPKSSESSLPKHSNGRRDDYIQRQYLRAMYDYWGDPANNITDAETGVQMIDMSRAHVWAWDMRPFPWFPGNIELWSDGGNYPFGHWLNGRASARSLASVVGEICERSGVTDYDVSALHGVVRGYSVGSISGARATLQPLMLAHGFEAAEREGKLVFSSRRGDTDHALDREALAITGEQDVTLSLTRAPTAETAGRVRLNFVEAEGDYEVRSSEAIFPDEVSRAVSQSEFPLVLLQSEGQAITERWLAESRVARDRASFALPPSATGIMAGDVVEIETDAGTETYRLDHVEQSGVAMVNAVRIEPGLYEPSDSVEAMVRPKPFVPAVPAFPLFMDLPLITGEEVEHAPHLGVVSQPWPGSIALYSAGQDAGYDLNRLFTTNATMGVTESTLFSARHGVVDHGPALRVRMSNGTLDSVSMAQVLNGANLAAIGDGTPENWEVFQFLNATLVEDGVYDLTGRLRGQLGSDAMMPDQWPVGSYVVLLDDAIGQIKLNANERGLARHYRVGPAGRPYDDPVYQHRIEAFNGIGLRPYAPVHLEAVANGADLEVSWIRRTRSEGDSWQTSEVPLGESAESYLVRVLEGESLLREETVTTPGWTYTAAAQGADGVGGTFNIDVAQVSERFGPGLFRRLTVSI